MRLSGFGFLVALLLGIMACNSKATPQDPSQAAPQENAASSNSENGDVAGGDLARAPELTESNASPNSNESKKMNPEPGQGRSSSPPPSSSKGATRVQMRNVDFHTQEPIVLRIRYLHGALLRTRKVTPPVFDDKQSFTLRIDSGTVGIRTDSLTYLFNNYVFAYPRAPLKKLRFETDGNKVKMTGKLHKGFDVPFKIVGDIAATAEGKIRLHPTSIKAAGIPVKGLMKLFGVQLAELLKTGEARGVSINDNDIILDPELMLPPPTIRGRINSVRVEGDEVIQDFGGKSSRPGPGKVAAQKGPNYMYFRGGTLRFGKLTMSNADLRILDANPTDTFDFSLDHYNSQLVAGHSKNTPNFGLVVIMPDYNKLRRSAVKEPGYKGTELSKRG